MIPPLSPLSPPFYVLSFLLLSHRSKVSVDKIMIALNEDELSEREEKEESESLFSIVVRRGRS